jgi:hypothetical protein
LVEFIYELAPDIENQECKKPANQELARHLEHDHELLNVMEVVVVVMRLEQLVIKHENGKEKCDSLITVRNHGRSHKHYHCSSLNERDIDPLDF